MDKNLSPFEERFGQFPNHFTEDEKLIHCIAVIRDAPGNNELLLGYVDWSSIMSDPGCVLYAIYDALDDLKKLKDS